MTIAGSGPHSDLNAHVIDLARWLVGEIASVVGMQETFIRQRPLEQPDPGTTMIDVTVEDASLFMARFTGGAIGSFEANRMAGGRKKRFAF